MSYQGAYYEIVLVVHIATTKRCSSIIFAVWEQFLHANGVMEHLPELFRRLFAPLPLFPCTLKGHLGNPDFRLDVIGGDHYKKLADVGMGERFNHSIPRRASSFTSHCSFRVIRNARSMGEGSSGGWIKNSESIVEESADLGR